MVSGLPSPAGTPGAAGYLNYVTPGVLLLAVAAAVQGTAIVVAMDMTGGIIDRFRTMAIARSAVLTGHVLASLVQTLASIVVVIGVAIALGFRPTAGVLGWLAAIGMLGLFSFALTWLATALGLAAKSVETASNTPMFLMLLVFLGSGFVPAATMPTGLEQFARYQPFTPVTETAARAAHRHSDRLQRRRRHRLEHRARPRLVRLGDPPLQTPEADVNLRGS